MLRILSRTRLLARAVAGSVSFAYRTYVWTGSPALSAAPVAERRAANQHPEIIRFLRRH